MKSIDAGVGAVPMREKKEAEAGKIEEKEYIYKKNEMIFYLREYPECQISGVAEWQCENTYGGEAIGDVDTYFLHILTGQRCETPWACILGVAEFNEYHEEIWETLCMRIENLKNIEEVMCYQKTVEV